MVVLSIIILNYKTPRLTLRLLESLFKHYEKELKEKKFEIITADNASGDDSVNLIKESKYYKNIKFVENEKNFGFGVGNNKAAQKAKGDLLVFINSDTVAQDKGFLKMIEFMKENKDVAVLGGRLIDDKGQDRAPAGKFYTIPYLIVTLFFSRVVQGLRFIPNKTKSVDWVSGAYMMVRNKVFDEIKGFDENIFMYLEDMEICYRIKKLGYRVVFFSDSSLYHLEQGSSNRSFAIINIYKGILYFYKKHKSPFSYYLVKLLLIFKAGLLVLIGKMLNNKYLTDTYSKALKV